MIGIIIGLVSIITTIIVGIFPNPIRDFIIDKWWEPLKIVPNRKDVFSSQNGNNWNENFFIYLINNTNYTYYDINIVSEFPDSIDVNIFPENSNEFSSLKSKNGEISIGSDFMILGENRAKKTKIVQTVINNIGPSEKKKIKIDVDKKNYKKEFCLNFKVSGFKKTAKPIFNK